MKDIVIRVPKTHLDGSVHAINVALGTLAPVTVVGASFLSSARIIICDNTSTQQQLMTRHYQMSDPVPAGVVFELASNALWKHFDFQAPEPKPAKRQYFLHPQGWEPVTLQSATGKLYAIIEARTGNTKHKATLEVTLHIKT